MNGTTRALRGANRGHALILFGGNLARTIEQVDRLVHIPKSSLRPGDHLVVTTANSVYSLRAMANGFFRASGGWFDREGRAPMMVQINGCTWGGSAIKTDAAAAPGLCLEFSTRLRTSPIRSAVVFPLGSLH